MKHKLLLGLIFISFLKLQAQLIDECKLSIGTNLAGPVDYGQEIAFVDLMRSCREWIPRDEENVHYDYFDLLSYRPDGYPTHLPQTIPGIELPLFVETIWAITKGWPAGEYTVLWEGTGEIAFNSGNGFEITSETDHRLTFNFPNPGIFVAMKIKSSDINDPIHNIRVLMPGTEQTYQEQPFYDVWLEKIKPFQSFRFMDWGRTNNWGRTSEGWDVTELFDWEDRARMDNYTWADTKGVPYEMMVKLMNELDVDGWVCVPHRASDDYIRNMATFFKDHLEPERHLYVEYSNELWNWIFGQAQWVNWMFNDNENVSWPQRIGHFVNNCLGIWTEVYDGELDKITRVVGGHQTWPDLCRQICVSVDSGYYDSIASGFYFSYTTEAEEIFDEMGANATVDDIAYYARENMPRYFDYLEEIKALSNELNKKLTFYEGGQHFTPNPFGVEPTYAQALMDIQRADVMYEMYNEWFNMIRTLQEGEEPLLLMNFSFIGDIGARYGSWGILESMYQDTDILPAPKYQAVIENMGSNCRSLSVPTPDGLEESISMAPIPMGDVLQISGVTSKTTIRITDMLGKLHQTFSITSDHTVDVSSLSAGLYFVKMNFENTSKTLVKKVVKK